MFRDTTALTQLIFHDLHYVYKSVVRLGHYTVSRLYGSCRILSFFAKEVRILCNDLAKELPVIYLTQRFPTFFSLLPTFYVADPQLPTTTYY